MRWHALVQAAEPLTGSPFLRRTLIATNRQHAYLEGAQRPRWEKEEAS